MALMPRTSGKEVFLIDRCRFCIHKSTDLQSASMLKILAHAACWAVQKNRVPRKISHHQEECNAKKAGFLDYIVVGLVLFAGGNMAIAESTKVFSKSQHSKK